MSEYGSEGSCWAPGSPEVPVGLGCIPWRVTPEDDGYRGPVCSADGSIVAVADARIDNRDELASSLGIAPRDMAGMSDTQLVLGAWRRWEHECPRHLVGDFAFALWDGRRGELFCARDALGQRVLFYHESAYGVELATTAEALATLPHVDAALDEQKVADFLVLLQRPERSFFQS
ncbi:MAG TPA: hypothetical protein VMM83_02455, partial [Longimicrobiales bacterium]|nr:hypothetical protein [Longimicrobiales bacterium]